MKLKADAVREVLLYIEDNIQYKEGFMHTEPLTHKEILIGIKRKSKKYTEEEIKCAIEALLTSPLLDYAEKPKYVPSTGDLISVKIRGLTFEGHNFVANIKSSDVWNTVKKIAGKAEDLSIKTLCSVSETVAKTWLEDPSKIIKVLQSAEALRKFLSDSVSL